MGYRSNLYDVVLVLHILSAIVGFGGVMLNGIYGSQAKAMGGVGAHAITAANVKASTIAEKFIYAVPVFGVLMVVLSDGVVTFDQTWLWLAIAIYSVAMLLSATLLVPASKRMVVLTAELASAGPPPGAAAGGPPPQAVELEQLGKRAAAVGGILHLAVVSVLALMVFKPGI